MQALRSACAEARMPKQVNESALIEQKEEEEEFLQACASHQGWSLIISMLHEHYCIIRNLQHHMTYRGPGPR